MGYDIYFGRRNKSTREFETIKLREKNKDQGGTYLIGGSEEAWLYITFNYSKFFTDSFKNEDGIKCLINKTIKQCYSKVNKAIKWMEDNQEDDHLKPDEDYWKATQGNAYKALKSLRHLIQVVMNENPDTKGIICVISY